MAIVAVAVVNSVNPEDSFALALSWQMTVEARSLELTCDPFDHLEFCLPLIVCILLLIDGTSVEGDVAADEVLDSP